VRSFIPARRGAAVLAALALISVGAAGTAQAAKGGGKPTKGGTVIWSSSTSTTTASATTVRDIHTTTCPKVMEYTSCGSMSVTIDNFGATGWNGSASPANNAVKYNTYYGSTSWANVVAHEAGGHVDAWNEIVAKVGAAQAWTDYYDLDYFGELWAEARYHTLKGTAIDLSRTRGKEIYLDCVGPVAHGYTGGYVGSLAGGTLAGQQSFCSGSGTVMSDALTKVRPS
jgi:hypothetical protein